MEDYQCVAIISAIFAHANATLGVPASKDEFTRNTQAAIDFLEAVKNHNSCWKNDVY